MASLTWQQAIDVVLPYVFRISTPGASGTGFLFAYTGEQRICGIATAAHVIEHAHAWEQPIRLHHLASNATLLLHPGERAVVIERRLDTAAIICDKGTISLPETPLDLLPEGKFIRVGVEIGWVGFPAVAPDSLCFFSGRISAWMQDQGYYLVDGVAINGVSGGPAFDVSGPMVIGVLSAYIPNRATGVALPGLSVVQDVVQLQEITKQFHSFQDAKSKQTPPEDAASQPAKEGEV